MNFKNKKCLILGFGREGKSCLSFLEKMNVSCIGVSDKSKSSEKEISRYPSVDKWHIGTNWLSDINDYDIIIKSPGVPMHLLSSFKGEITNATNIFLYKNRDKTIAITGTKGKSTSVSLLHHILRSLGINSILGGNIGVPPLELMDHEADIYILELSSYQIENATSSPKIGVILNIFPDHLDHHITFEAYRSAKLNLLSKQTEADLSILPSSEKAKWLSLVSNSSNKIFFSSTDSNVKINNEFLEVFINGGDECFRVRLSELPIKGRGMLENACAVLECIIAASRIGIIPLQEKDIKWNVVFEAMKSFMPLPHRLQEIRASNGTLFVNDSISTIPEATINALEVYKDKVETLILGGYDRGISYDSLLKYIPKTQIKTLLLVPPVGERLIHLIEEDYLQDYSDINIIICKNYSEVIKHSFKHTSPDKVCLLSPAAPSFGMFKNFERRGERFMGLVLSHS